MNNCWLVSKVSLFQIFVVIKLIKMSNSDFCDAIDPELDVFLSQLNETDLLRDRFNHRTSDKEISETVKDSKPKNTSKQETWAIKIWSQWAVCRNADVDFCDITNYPVPIIFHKDMNFQKFEIWLPKFIMEVRKQDGNEYKPEVIKQILASIYRYLKDSCNYDGPSFLDKKSKIFKVLEAKMKEMKKRGLGLEIKRADVMTEDDEGKLWSSGVLNMETSRGLFNAIFVYNGKVLALRGREEHRKLEINQFKIKVNSQGIKVMEFWPILRKNQHGNIVFDQMRKEPIKHYDDPNNAQSYVKILEKYLLHLPETSGAFYRKPIDSMNKISYSRQPVGINTLCSLLRNLFCEAGIDVSSRFISNHGLRATAATNLLKSGFDKSLIKKRTGHKSDALDAYLRHDDTAHQETSKCLDPINVDSSQDRKRNVDEISTVNVKNDNNLTITVESGSKKIKIDISG